MRKLLHWLGLHNYKFVKFHDLYEGDLGYTLKCKICGKKKYSSGQPMW